MSYADLPQPPLDSTVSSAVEATVTTVMATFGGGRPGLRAAALAGQRAANLPSTYHKFALEEMIPIGLMFTGLSALRYFRDDHGYTLVERGVSRLRGSARRVNLTRMFAVLFGVHLITFVLYTIPAAWMVTHPVPWPEDTMNRSYFTSGLCGEGTDRACSGPRVPFATNESGYMTRDGKLAFPP